MNIFKSNVAVGITAALAATVLAPVLLPVIAAAGRPLAKSLVKGGVILYEKGREAVAGAGEVMEDMIAEVRSELEQKQEGVAAYPEEEAAGSPMPQAVRTVTEAGGEQRHDGRESIARRATSNGAQQV